MLASAGPNYALAKRMQHWRAMIAFDAGCTVSSNVAPSTATISVTSNKMFARAYIGMPYFKPYVTLRDIQVRPATPVFEVGNTMQYTSEACYPCL